MSRVVGIGGVFIKAKDPQALRAWYRDYLEMDIEEWGGMVFFWNSKDGPGEGGTTTWSIFDESTEYFGQSPSRCMINFIVNDLDTVLNALRNEGCDVDQKIEESEYGRFGWVMDPEDNRVELWEPPDRNP